jgi:hypothetical protein
VNLVFQWLRLVDGHLTLNPGPPRDLMTRLQVRPGSAFLVVRVLQLASTKQHTFLISVLLFNIFKMTLSKLGVFASLALAASAILLPPTITAEELGDDITMEGVLFDPFKRSVALECPGCALAIQKEQGISWKENAGNTFVSNLPQNRAHGCQPRCPSAHLTTLY